MRRLLLPLAALLLVASPALAVIKKLVPLKEVLTSEEYIFVAEVDKIDPDKPSVVFTFVEHLKGKAPFERMPVNLTGDNFAKKDNHTKEMLARLVEKRKAVFFVSAVGKEYSCFGFMEGTWFQLRGTKDGEPVRWAFLHCEPYFRRTFKGTTTELKAVVIECLAGKRKPPEPDEKEPPGYGPLPEKKENPDKKAPAPLAPRPSSLPLFAVIPSFVVLGPLAVVAALFPGAAATLAAGLKRWRVFFVIAGVNSTLALAYWGLREAGWLPNHPAASPRAYGLYLLAVTAVGLQWAGRRYRNFAAHDPSVTETPSRKELLTLLAVTAAVAALAGGTALYAGWREAVLLPGDRASGMGKEFTAIALGLLAATLYAGYRMLSKSVGEAPTRMSLSGETAALWAVFLFGSAVLVATWPREQGPAALVGELGDAGVAEHEGPKLDTVQLWFETADFHEVMSTVCVAEDRVYFGTGKQTGFRSGGAVLCLDRATGKEVWRFTDDGGLKPVFATPTVASGHVYAGEGLHTDVERRLFRLDAATGKPSWPQPVATLSHTEGTPRVVNGKVYFSAGDDGLYCVEAADGTKVWHFQGSEQKLHIDTPPAVANGRVFAGSGYRTFALLAIDAEKGTELWRTPVKLRSFGPPLVLGDRVVYGLGTGNLTEDLASESEEGIPTETQPAGAVVCVDASTGQEAWRYDTPKSVHTALAADARTVYAACRDGSVYALDRKTGKLRWRRSLGSALTAGPAVASYAGGALTLAVYAVSQEGLVACLSPADGKVLWTRDLRAQVERDVQVISTPVLIDEGARRTLLLGAMLTQRNNGTKSAAVFRIEDVVE